MPDDSRPGVTFAQMLRGWPDDELRKGEHDPLFGEAIRAELARRARPCTCYIAGSVSDEKWRQAVRVCPQHQGRRP